MGMRRMPDDASGVLLNHMSGLPDGGCGVDCDLGPAECFALQIPGLGGKRPSLAGVRDLPVPLYDFMLKFLLLLFLLVSICVAIHGFGMVYGLRWVKHKRPSEHHHFSVPAMFWILVRVVYGLLLLHLVQITAWALCYLWGGGLPDFATAFYYSATSYSTVGYGDVVPEGHWRILGSVEAVTGVLMFGWSTGVLFSVVNHLLGKYHERS